MRKKLICLLLLLALCLSLAGCGGVSYGVNPVITLVSQEYSMAFRNGDSLYYYVTAALEELSAEGAITELSRKWLGSNMVSFPKKAGALSAYQPPEPRIFIIGVDENSFPFAYGDNGNYWGFDVELATKLCQKLGWTLQVHVVEKENVRIELYSGNIDCAWGGLALPQEEIENGSYTIYGPYVQNDIVIASRALSGEAPAGLRNMGSKLISWLIRTTTGTTTSTHSASFQLSRNIITTALRR